MLLCLVMILQLSCQKKTGIDAPTIEITDPDVNNLNPTVDLNLDLSNEVTSSTVSPDFLGFSYEKTILTDGSYFTASNLTLVNLYKNLGSGMIRIGGNRVENTKWSNGSRGTSEDNNTVFTSDVDRYKSFDDAVGWRTMWGLNFGTINIQDNADEANYTNKKLGTMIQSFAIGNEPDFISYSGYRPKDYTYEAYRNEYKKYSDQLLKLVPGIKLSGSESVVPYWQIQFAKDFSSRINMLTGHYYVQGPAGDKSVSITKLLIPDPKLVDEVTTCLEQARKINVPYRLSETNTVTGGGQNKISNAHASALWGTNFLFYLAQSGVSGVNFHGGNGLPYTPIDKVDGQMVARPLYYGMLLFHLGQPKQFLKNNLQTQSDKYNSYYFDRTDGKKGIILINKDDGNNISVSINGAGSVKNVTQYNLQGNNLASLTSTNINSATVGKNGIIDTKPVSVKLVNNSLSDTRIKVYSGSACLLILE